MSTASSYGLADYDYDASESATPRMQRMHRSEPPLRGKYIKKCPPLRRGIKQRRNRRVTW